MTPPSGIHRIFFIIFVSSLSSLAYEISLVRIFSITLWYHFAFLVISIAMLGIGASGTVLTIFPRLKNLHFIPLYCLFLSLSIPISYLMANAIPFDPAKLAWDKFQILFIGLYSVVLSVPFFWFGLIVSTAFSLFRNMSGAVYASDLLGAGTGSILVFWLLFQGGPEKTIFIFSALLASAAMACADRMIRTGAITVIIANIVVLGINPAFVSPRISPYKPLQAALKFPAAKIIETLHSPYARIDLFTSPAVRFAPGLSLMHLDPLPPQTGIASDGGDIQAITHFSRDSDKDFLNKLPSSLPYYIADPEDILILEPKGGLGLAMARHFNAKNIIGIDSNPLLLDTVKKYSDGYMLADMTLFSGLGRTWLSASKRTFDIIDIAIPGAAPFASYGFAEDYRFTIQAFENYIMGLKPNGVLSLTLYILPPPRAELRMAATIIAAAEKLGITNVSNRIASIRTWGTITILFKHTPFNTNDINSLKKFCRERRFDLIYYPGMRREDMNRYIKTTDNTYSEAFSNLFNETTRKTFINEYIFDIQPVYDSNPFAQYHLKIENIGKIYRTMGKKWQFFFEEGYLLPLLLVQVIVLSCIVMLLPLLKIKTDLPDHSGLFMPLLYFSIIGLAYLFMEVSIIQKMILLLEQPVYAASTVIASILTSSGVGSFFNQRSSMLKQPKVLIALAGVAALYTFVLPSITAEFGSLSLPAKISLIFILLLPIGFLMGIPLPLGMEFIGKHSPYLIPWAWAVNGCFSVLSPILAVMIAITAGYDFVVLLGAGLYSAAFLTIHQLSARVS